MACRFDTAGTTQSNSEALFRSASVPNSTTLSACWWMQIVTDTNAIGIVCILRDNSYGAWAGVYLHTDGVTLRWDDTNGNVTGSALAVGTWYHVGFTKSSGTIVVYLNGVSNITRSTAPNPTVNGITFGSVGNMGTGIGPELFNGRLAAVKVWSGVALSAAEIQQEMRQIRPRRLANIWGFYPLLSNAAVFPTDYSGQGNTLTAVGTLSVEDGPPIALEAFQRQSLWHRGDVVTPPRTSRPPRVHPWRFYRRVA